MTGFERATLRWARAAVIMSGLAAIFVCLQWWEMHTASADTHNLAVAARNQATWTQNLATQMQAQADRTKDLADRMKDQADRTKDLADRTEIIADEAVVQAKAAKSTAQTADETLTLSERAYLILGSPTDEFHYSRIFVPIINTGHIPSGHAEAVVHEVTFSIDNPKSGFYPAAAAIEAHWQRSEYQSIPAVSVGGLFNIEIHLPKVTQSDIQAGRQGIVAVIVLSYNDGFPRMPVQSWTFCDESTFDTDRKLLTMRPCDSPTSVLPVLMHLDHYPDERYKR